MNSHDLWQTVVQTEAGYALRLTLTLLHSLWEGAALVAGYAMLARVLRSTDANLRYAAGVATLLLIAACLPATFLLLPTAPPPTTLTFTASVEASRHAVTNNQAFPPPSNASTRNVVQASVSPEQRDDKAATSAHSPIIAWWTSATRRATGFLAVSTRLLAPYASGLYLCGVILMLFRMLLGLWGGHQLRQACEPVTDNTITTMVRNHVRRLGIHIVPLVAYSRRVSVPVVVGILRPMILLPIGLGSGLTLPQLETILIHELAHIRRFDLAINLLQRLIEALLFFHPAVWWLSRRISIERENACDDTVLRSYCRGIQYADALVRMAELCEAFASNSIGNSAATTASLAANGRNASQFKRRVQRLLGVAEEPRLRLSVLGVLISLAMLSSVVLTPVSWLVAENAMVTECPRLTDVLFVGCEEISRKTLQRECGMKAGDPVDPHAAEEARRTLETFYQEKGFRNVRVALLEGDRPTDKRAVFLINEQVAQRQYEIDFAGCTAINSEKLHRVLKDNSRHILFGVGVRSSAGLVGEATIDRQLDREQMDKDQKRLLAYYRSLGFFKAHIGVEPTYNEKGNGVTITHVINEGPRFKIRNVSVVGNTQYSSEELMADMKLKSSDYFDQSKADADRRLIADKYGSIGYVYADVRPDNLLLEQPGSMDVVYTIKEGSRYRVGRIDIDIKGDCPHTQVYTVLNQLAFKPGDIVDTRKIRESEMRLKSSDLIGVNGEHYSTVKIAWAPVAAQEPDQTEANLNVCIFAVP